MDLEPGRLIAAFAIMVFLLITIERLLTPDFLQLLGFNGISLTQLQFYLSFIKPLVVLGVFVIVSIIGFGVSPMTGAFVGLFGLAAYLMLTSPIFFEMIGLNPEEQENVSAITSFMMPVVITGITVLAVMVVGAIHD